MYESFNEENIMKITTRKRIKIQPFPDGEPPDHPEWQHSLYNSKICFPEGHPQLERILRSQWEVTLRWVAKLKWRNPDLIILDHKEFKALKPQAEVLLAFLNLCIELHTGFGSEYHNAGAWWRDIALEFQCTLRSDYYRHTEFFLAKNSKSRIVRKISRGENPFDPIDLKRMHYLAESAIKVRSSSAIFDDLFEGSQRQKTKGLGFAFSAWQTASDRGPTTAIAIDGDRLLTNGRGGIQILSIVDNK